MPKPGDRSYKGPVHETVNKLTGGMFSKQTASTRRRPKKKPTLTKSSGSKRASRIQESTTKLMRKGVRSYADARSMAEYGHSKRSTPASPTIDRALSQIASTTKRSASAVKSASKRKRRGKKTGTKRKVRSALAKTSARIKARNPGMSTKRARRKGRKIIRARGGGKGDTR